jgi:hypothetical protein
MLRRRIIAPGTALALAVALLPFTTSGALAAAGVALPFTGPIFDVVVDGGHDHVFVAGGAGESTLEVFDYAGDSVASLAIGGASGMVVVGNTMYVAAADDDDVAVVNLAATPPAVAGSVAIGSLQGPSEIGYGGGRLWFSAVDGGSQDVYAMGTNGSNLAQQAISFNGSQILTSPADPDLLLFAGGASVGTFDVSGPDPALLHDETYPSGAGNIHDAAFGAGGASFLIASGSPYNFPEIRTSDLANLSSYAAKPYPTAIDVSSQHGGLIAGGIDGIYDDDVWVYHAGVTDAFWTWDFGLDKGTVEKRGIAWADDASALFVVTDDYSSSIPRMHVLHPLASVSSLDLSVSKSLVHTGDRVTVTAELGSGSPNRTIRIYATKYGGSRQLIKESAVGSAGRLTVRYEPRVKTTFEAEYDGDAEWSSATAGPTAVRVKVVTTGILSGFSSTSGKYRIYRPDARAKYSAKVTPNHGGDNVHFSLEGHNGRRWVHLSNVSLALRADSTRAVFVTGLASGIPYRVRSSFSSDGDHVGDSAPWSYLKVLSGRLVPRTSAGRSLPGAVVA